MKNRFTYAKIAFLVVVAIGFSVSSNYFAIKDRIHFSDEALELRKLETERTRRLMFVDHNGLQGLIQSMFNRHADIASSNFFDGSVSQQGGIVGVARLIGSSELIADPEIVSDPDEWINYNAKFLFREGVEVPVSYEVSLYAHQNRIPKLVNPELRNVILECTTKESQTADWRGQRVEVVDFGTEQEIIKVSGNWPPPFIALPLSINSPQVESFYVGDLARLGEFLRKLCVDPNATVGLGPKKFGGFTKKYYEGAASIIVSSNEKHAYFDVFASEQNGRHLIQLNIPTAGSGSLESLDQMLLPRWEEKLNSLVAGEHNFVTRERLNSPYIGEISVMVEPDKLGNKQTHLERKLRFNRPISLWVSD